MDLIDRANDAAEQILAAQRSQRRHHHLMAMGACHYCSELLPKVGQLFCGKDCSEDFESEARMRQRAGERDGR